MHPPARLQCMYSAANYTSTSHPPLVGYGLDGVPIFGRYLYQASPGFSTPLDDCGGHTHTGIGDPYIPDSTYHYRASSRTAQTCDVRDVTV